MYILFTKMNGLSSVPSLTLKSGHSVKYIVNGTAGFPPDWYYQPWVSPD